MLQDYQLEEYLDAATSENREWLASEGTVLSTTRNVSSMQEHDGIGNDSRVKINSRNVSSMQQHDGIGSDSRVKVQYQLEECLVDAVTS